MVLHAQLLHGRIVVHPLIRLHPLDLVRWESRVRPKDVPVYVFVTDTPEAQLPRGLFDNIIATVGCTQDQSRDPLLFGRGQGVRIGVLLLESFELARLAAALMGLVGGAHCLGGQG
jgi:hypothetical protein